MIFFFIQTSFNALTYRNAYVFLKYPLKISVHNIDAQRQKSVRLLPFGSTRHIELYMELTDNAALISVI